MKFFTQTYLWAIQMFHVEVQGLQIFHGNVSIFLCKYSDSTMSIVHDTAESETPQCHGLSGANSEFSFFLT